jgi:hypothetical protein
MAKLFVVDTNVVAAADGKASCTADCTRASLNAVRQITQRGSRLAIDDAWRIISEYRMNLNYPGQPGIARAFLKWVLINQGNRKRCVRVPITSTGSDSEDFAEFPKHRDLASFDPSDRKFVAVAARHPEHPPILQATDTKWWGWNKALSECEIEVRFLCLQEITNQYNKKFAPSSGRSSPSGKSSR